MFLVRAKNSTYIANKNSTASLKPNSHDYHYSENDYTYIDSYVGNQNFAGEEAVWVKNMPVYAMNYYGNVLNSNFNADFLKEALSLASIEKPFRGPEFYQNGDYSYHCNVTGDLDFFYGNEEIYCKHDKVYKCVFHGGNVS